MTKVVPIFQVLAAALVGAAAYFLWGGNSEWAFAAFAIAVCSYFFAMRFQIKARLEERRAAEAPASEPED